MFKKIILILILFSALANGATISGTAFKWYSLEPLDNVIIEINTTPKQIIVSENGDYSFDVSAGNYILKAQYFENNKLVYETEEEIIVENDGVFIVDLLLFPSLIDDESLLDDFNDSILSPEEIAEETDNTANDNNIIAGMVLIVVALILIFYGARKITTSVTGLKTERIGIEEKYFERPKEFLKKETDLAKDELDKDTKEVLEILKRYGGRMTQKDLREKVTFGEAKTSLVVAELENSGKIKKFKKGRGNIIILK
ncbi:MAG: hypothetical protein CL944_01225 [Candidatus Diapherotrites archaeon]|uniref:DUF7343 domain-containing protein n=1 Tax=Candidatus Iainarchaeum sp. TaxID=3101447 RepID=A0A2D6LPG6_9ARCH|nr:hypothetical protein [Candidatus Diapherotrites archaeon]|tara:strand:- start:2286 stop:3053 length:768 start_codon:yes stop_codon:yes gene_type:complete